MNFYIDESDRDELAAQVRFERKRLAQYIAHPNPRDPDYPGDPEDFPGYEGDDE